ncbi:MAG: hypothetical protein SGILL_008511, partial [Bacillariaceae sp.]
LFLRIMAEPRGCAMFPRMYKDGKLAKMFWASKGTDELSFLETSSRAVYPRSNASIEKTRLAELRPVASKIIATLRGDPVFSSKRKNSPILALKSSEGPM